VRVEGFGKLKKSISSETQTGDLVLCSIVPQPTTLITCPLSFEGFMYFIFIYDLLNDAVTVTDYLVLSSRMINER
jgi:hypothetical protein